MSSPLSTPLRASGLPLVDSGWGGLVPGQTYLLVGHVRSGRLRFSLQILQAGVEAEESALLVSSRAPEALVEQAQAQGFDLAKAYQSGLVRLLRVPAAADLVPLGDEGLSQALDDLGSLTRAQRPARLVVDDFTAFVQFRTFAAFQAAFKQLVAAANESGTILILGFGEPANDGSRRLLAAIEDLVGGSIRVTLAPDGSTNLKLVPEPTPKAPAPARPFAFTETPLMAPASASNPTSEAPVQGQTPATAPSFESTSDGFGSHTESEQPELIVSAPRPPQAPSASSAPARATMTVPVQEAGAAAIQPVLAPTLEPAPTAEQPAPESAPDGMDTPFGPDSFELDPFMQIDPDGSDASIIRPIDPADSPFSADDPFGQYLGPDLLSLGHFVDSDIDGATEAHHEPLELPTQPPASPPQAESQQQAYVPRAAHPSAPPPVPAPAPEPEPQTHLPLRRALKEAFATRNTRAFMVLALRYEDDSPYADLMPAIGEALRAALGDRGVLEADIAVPRTVAFLPGVDGDAAPLLFEAIQSYLRAVAPQRADDALAAINALVVPNGQPFNSANELIAYIFEG